MSDKVKVDNEPKKRFLRQYAECVRRINRINDELDELRLMKMCPSAKQSDGMPHGHGGTNDLSGYAAKLDRMMTKLIMEKYKRMKLFDVISEQINKLGDQNEIDVLFYRYIKQYDWYRIAERMNYTERHIHRIHGEALLHFELPNDVIECQ